MAVKQSKIDKEFSEDLLARFVDDMCDYSDEQLRFEQGELGMHATSEDKYSDWCSGATYVVEEYYEDLDLFDILDLELGDDGHFIFEDSMEDLASFYEVSVNNHLAKIKLESCPSSKKYINGVAISFLSTIEKRIDVDVEKYFERDFDSEVDYNRVFIDIIEDSTNDKLKELFNKDSLKKNPLYKHFVKLIRESIVADYENHLVLNKNEKIKRPYYFKHINDFNLTYKEAKNILEINEKYSNLIKNKSKLKKDDPQYFNMLEMASFESMYDGLIKMIEKSELDKYVKRFIGSYKNLLNEESLDIFKEIKRLKIDEKKIRYNLSKISIMDDSESLNSALNKVLQNTNSFDFVKMSIEKDDLNAPVIYESERFLVVAMLDYKSSQKLSSTTWCISSSKSYFNQYSKPDNVNLSVYDDKASTGGPSSQIGLTINKDGEISYAFDRNNKSLKGTVNNSLKNILPDIVKGVGLKDDFMELMKFKNNVKELDVNSLKNKVFVINRLGDEYLKRCDFTGLNTSEIINDLKKENVKSKKFTEDELMTETSKFEKTVNFYNKLKEKKEDSLKDYINSKMTEETLDIKAPSRLRL